MRTTHPKGVRPWKGGLQAYVRVKGIGLLSKQFPADTKLEVLKAWRLAQKLRTPSTKRGEGLSKDVEDYLSRIKAMPTFNQRKRHLTTWTALLGERRARSTVTPGELEAIYQTWLQQGLSPGEVRKRRGSLSTFYTRLDGRHAFNPAKASIPPRAERPQVRGIDPVVAARILSSMQESKTQARLMVITWTGLPPAIVEKIAPADLDLKAQTVRVHPRRKGSGAPARTLSLLPQAVEAFKLFDRLDAYGPFSEDAANANFKRAAKKLDPPITGIRLYDLRHGFATLLYRATQDLATTARFLLHSTTKMTERYAAGAAADVDKSALAKVTQMLT